MSPPRDNIVRTIWPGPELRAAESDDSIGLMTGHFAVFNQWTEIDSIREGHFMERIAPGAFKRTFKENRDSIRVLYDHGQDPQIGNKVLGPVRALTEDAQGARYEVPLYDTSYTRDLLPGLKDTPPQYGASFRFSVQSDEKVERPKRSAYNPTGLPERTITDIDLFEFGPVTFPAYAGATAGVRSGTDEYLRAATRPTPSKGTPVSDAAPISRTDRPARMAELQTEINQIARDNPGVLPTDVDVRFTALTTELAAHKADETADEARMKWVTDASEKPQHVERTWEPPTVNVKRDVIRDIYDLGEIRNASRSPEHEKLLLRDSALRAAETATFPTAQDKATRAACAEQIDSLIRGNLDGDPVEVAQRILTTGSPAYRRFFHKYVAGGFPTPEEQRAAAMTTFGTTTGGFAVVYELDPTFLPTSNGAVNPYRRMARVVQTTSNEWRGVTSGGVVAAYAAEAAAATEQGPTLAQPAAIVQKAHTYVTFSIEAGMDIANLEGQLAVEIQDAKDVLEAVQFTTGVGTTVFPQGIEVGATVTYNTATTLVLAAADLYGAEGTLPPRFRPKARFLASRFIYNKIRAIDTAGGAQLWTENLTVGLNNNPEGNTGYNLLGYPADECSGMPSTIAQNDLIMVLGDFNYFVIVDRIGLNIEIVPLVTNGATPNFPTGQRGVYAYWRNTSKVLSAAAFQVIKVV